MSCDHEDYKVKRIGGFTFCICKCGFQWKGDKPFSIELKDD